MVFGDYLKDEMEVDRLQGADQDDDSQVDDSVQDDFDLYKQFVEWLGDVGSDLEAVIRNNESFITTATGKLWIGAKGKIECQPRGAEEPWQILWDMWQKELA